MPVLLAACALAACDRDSWGPARPGHEGWKPGGSPVKPERGVPKPAQERGAAGA